MSSAGRAANSNGCASRPKEHATGLIGFAAQIRRSSVIGSCAMETAEHREPCELRGSRTDLGAPGRASPATRPKPTSRDVRYLVAIKGKADMSLTLPKEPGLTLSGALLQGYDCNAIRDETLSFEDEVTAVGNCKPCQR